MKKLIKAGMISHMEEIVLRDASTGQPKTGVLYSGVTVTQIINGASAATTPSAVTASLGTWTSMGWVEFASTGCYQFGVPNAGIAGGAGITGVTYLFAASGCITARLEFEFEAIDRQDGVRGGMTALPNAAAAAVGGLFTRGTGAGQINQAANGQIDANTTTVNGTAQTAGGDIGLFAKAVILGSGTATAGSTTTLTLQTALGAGHLVGALLIATGGAGAGQYAIITGYVNSSQVVTFAPAVASTFDSSTQYLILAAMLPKLDSGLKISEVTLTDTVTTYTGNTPQTGDAFARLGAPVGASISADIAEIEAETDGIAANVPANFAALGITAAGKISEVVLTDTLTTYTGNTVQTGDAFARLGAPAGASVSADVAAIKADTATIISNQGTLATGWTIVSGKIVWTSAALANGSGLNTTQAATMASLAVMISGNAFTAPALANAPGGSGGAGTKLVNQDTGGTDNLRIFNAADHTQEIQGATLTAYLTSDYNAGNFIVAGQAITDSQGRWAQPMYLVPGNYTGTASRTGFLTQVFTFTVT